MSAFFKIKKITLGLLVIFLFGTFFSLLPTHSVYGQDGYQPLAPIPGVTGGINCDPTIKNDPNCRVDFAKYIPAVVKLIIQIAGALAVIMIVVGGIQYVSTDAIQGKEEGKGKIQNAVYGLLLALASFVILQTLNPKTLELDLSITPISPLPTSTTTPPVAAGMCRAMQGGSRTLVNCSCLDCVTIGSSGTGSYGALPNTSTYGNQVNRALADKLVIMNAGLSSTNTSWRITEVWKPISYHVSRCHIDGTCVDASLGRSISNTEISANNFALNTLVQQINNFFAAANTAGIRAVFEVKTDTEANLLRARGVTGTILKVGAISAPHWSLYLN